MVLGYHVVFSAYGFWLPNDPRGSWSDFVRSWEVWRFGPATKDWSLQSTAGVAHDHAARARAKWSMRYPPVRFTGKQARAIGAGFADYIRKAGLEIWACSILQEHVHLVIKRHDYHAEQVVNLLKGAASRRINVEGLHPMARFGCRGRRIPSMWTRGLWKVFLDNAAGIRCAIDYVERNPAKEGKPLQSWSFVTPFE